MQGHQDSFQWLLSFNYDWDMSAYFNCWKTSMHLWNLNYILIAITKERKEFSAPKEKLLVFRNKLLVISLKSLQGFLMKSQFLHSDLESKELVIKLLLLCQLEGRLWIAETLVFLSCEREEFFSCEKDWCWLYFVLLFVIQNNHKPGYMTTTVLF